MENLFLIELCNTLLEQSILLPLSILYAQIFENPFQPHNSGVFSTGGDHSQLHCYSWH